ncbi:uncharacterized protein LOC104898088 [Beta vulgaris subsp. vulgaris]|uniref:uncharacterized protein LOC104898088 n=1 Tax=Beta vulgaris subsp. vulgaris TaxID=3555 RepID=UPI002546CE9B|nr:uncharacterized protein LOC104898088 [Beta vulgaris subsp. vulgaris]
MACTTNNNHAHLLIIHLFVLCLVIILEKNKADVGTWFNHGGNLANTRARPFGEPFINRNYIQRLHLRWKYFVGNDITATPAISNGVVYFPAWDGNLYAVNAFTGDLIWKVNLGQLTGLAPVGTYVNVTVARATPTVTHDMLIIGIYGPAVVVAINRFSPRLVWMTRLDPNPLALITMSGTAYLDGFYVGVSSLEELLPPTECCIFRGSMAKLDIQTGAIIWQTYTLPDNGGKLGGYSGAAIWGSSPAIDIIRNRVYVGSGNIYIAPPDVLECQAKQNNQSRATQPDQCTSPDAHFDSILAIDMNSGSIIWALQLGGYDVFYFACLEPNNPNCPPGPNLDADFGEAPMLLTIFAGGIRRDIVAAVQKSGYVWALDRDTGDIVWFNVAGPGGLEGGGVWGAATDGRRIYTNIVNSGRTKFRLAPSNETTTGGGWVALDANTGNILWTTDNPSNEGAHGPVTLVNDVLFAGSVDPSGPFYAMDAENGRILWSLNTAATIYGGASVSYGCVYVGHGYSVGLAEFHPTWNRGNSLFAFCIG